MDTIHCVIAGAILAAGKGSRIGLPKALLATGPGGPTFVERAIRVLRSAGVSPIVVVASEEIHDRVRQLAQGATVRVNPAPERGQLSSLHVAIDALAAEPVDALLVLPVDVPLVGAETVSKLIDVWLTKRLPVVRPARGTVHGHPVIFDARVLHELREADPALGAKSVVRKYALPETDIPIDDEGAFVDIDTIDDYRRAFGCAPAGPAPDPADE